MKNETVPDAIVRVIAEATQVEGGRLSGGAIIRQDDEYALVLPDGWLYLISIRPARVTAPTTAPPGG